MPRDFFLFVTQIYVCLRNSIYAIQLLPLWPMTLLQYTTFDTTSIIDVSFTFKGLEFVYVVGVITIE